MDEFDGKVQRDFMSGLFLAADMPFLSLLNEYNNSLGSWNIIILTAWTEKRMIAFKNKQTNKQTKKQQLNSLLIGNRPKRS